MKKYYKKILVGFICAICLCLGTFSLSFVNVKADTTEGEIVEETQPQEENTPTIIEHKYIDEDENGYYRELTLRDNNTYHIFMRDPDGGELSYDGTYEKIDNYIKLRINDEYLDVMIYEDGTFGDYIPPIDSDPIEEIPKEEIKEPEKGFIERNWEGMVTQFVSALSGVGLLLLFIAKTMRTVKKVMSIFVEQNGLNDKIINRINKIADKLEKGANVAEQAANKVDDFAKETEKRLLEIEEKCDEEFKSMDDTVNKLVKAFVAMVNNNDALIAQGKVKEINDIIDGIKEDKQEEQVKEE